MSEKRNPESARRDDVLAQGADAPTHSFVSSKLLVSLPESMTTQKTETATPVIETERLILREFQLTDAEFLYELNADPEVIQFTGDPAFASVQEAADLIKNYDQYKLYGYGRWSVITKEGNQFIGWCGLKNHPKEGFIDLGYRLFKSAWGNGYATEAAKACLEYGHYELGMKEIVARVLPENKASIRVIEKIGMTYFKTGTCGHDHDNALYYKSLR